MSLLSHRIVLSKEKRFRGDPERIAGKTDRRQIELVDNEEIGTGRTMPAGLHA